MTAQVYVRKTFASIVNGDNTATAPIWRIETAAQAYWRGKLVILGMTMNIADFTLCRADFDCPFRSFSRRIGRMEISTRFPVHISRFLVPHSSIGTRVAAMADQSRTTRRSETNLGRPRR